MCYIFACIVESTFYIGTPFDITDKMRLSVALATYSFALWL